MIPPLLKKEHSVILIIPEKQDITKNYAVFQIIADQLHLMQPEIATFAYTLPEYPVGIFASALIYSVRKAKTPF
ncbi:hypothetical protein SDC9_92842 [bioreactor metagenome]|uniref:Uncharacterized protein n=1 Tax=bioreactor metagenome TaxID=1076179 RepID=A0A645A8T4_9ZZZZ